MQSCKKVVGIDVSKGSLDYTWLPGGAAHQVANTAQGVTNLLKHIKKIGPDLVVLEATGGYQNLVVQALHGASVPVKVVNPRQVRDFARSLNRLGKTDKLDALTLAEFGQSRNLVPEQPRDAKRVELSQLLLRREQLQRMITAEKNHMEHACDGISSGIKEHLALMDGLLKNVDKAIQDIKRVTPEFSAHDALLQTIPGVGPVVSATLYAELPELKQLNRKEVAAMVGVAPFNKDSGKYRGQRHIWSGRAKIRTVMYCAMRSAIIWNPVIKQWFEHFRTSGKPYKVAVIACVRKLLVVIRAMLISGSKWNDNLHHA
jgi:transposase